MDELLDIERGIEMCPFCGRMGFVFRNRLWSGSHGYHGNYEYFAGCVNKKCKIRPRTRGVDDIYRSSEEAINMVIKDWNERM